MSRLQWLLAQVMAVARWVVAGVMKWVAQMRVQVARGQGLVEYSLILVLVAIVVIGALTVVGNKTSGVFYEINCRLSGGQMHRDNGNGNSNRCR